MSSLPLSISNKWICGEKLFHYSTNDSPTLIAGCCKSKLFGDIHVPRVPDISRNVVASLYFSFFTKMSSSSFTHMNPSTTNDTSASWGDIPTEIYGEILSFLPILPYYFKFSSVCKNWSEQIDYLLTSMSRNAERFNFHLHFGM